MTGDLLHIILNTFDLIQVVGEKKKKHQPRAKEQKVQSVDWLKYQLLVLEVRNGNEPKSPVH